MSECDWACLVIYNVCLCLSVTGCDWVCLVIYNVCLCLSVTGHVWLYIYCVFMSECNWV